MIEREVLTTEEIHSLIQKYCGELFERQGLWAEHIKSAHRGIPASTCHTCINSKTIIAMYNYRLDQLHDYLQPSDQT